MGLFIVLTTFSVFCFPFLYICSIILVFLLGFQQQARICIKTKLRVCTLNQNAYLNCNLFINWMFSLWQKWIQQILLNSSAHNHNTCKFHNHCNETVPFLDHHTIDRSHRNIYQTLYHNLCNERLPAFIKEVKHLN